MEFLLAFELSYSKRKIDFEKPFFNNPQKHDCGSTFPSCSLLSTVSSTARLSSDFEEFDPRRPIFK